MELEGVATVSVKAEVEEEEQPALDLSKTKVAVPGLKTEPKVEVVDDGDDDDDEEDEVVRRSRPPDTTTASLQGGWNLYYRVERIKGRLVDRFSTN